MKPHLYINSKGFPVTRHSYSGSETFKECARKYYLKRVQGWSERVESAATKFGIALEAAVKFWHQHKEDTEGAVRLFVQLWDEHKDKQYSYPKTDVSWNHMNLTGQEMVRLYACRYATFPYVVVDTDNFQVESHFEVFPGSALAGIEFTSYIDLLAEVKDSPGTEIIIDMKTSGKDVPDLTMMDPQLRSYAWVRRKPEDPPTPVGFLWFRKMGRTISKGDQVTVILPSAHFQPGDNATVLGKYDFGLWVTTDQEVENTMDGRFIGDAKAVKEARREFIEANGHPVPESCVTKQRVQFKSALITPESAEDIGRAIKKDLIDISNANKEDFWPMQSGVRYPNEKCPNCSMRGICSEQPALRDALVVRKQLDEFEFSKESE